MRYQFFEFLEKYRVKRYAFFLGLFLVIVGVVFSAFSISFAQNVVISDVVISSEKISYEDNSKGAWQLKKSAKWTGKGIATINFELDTIVKSQSSNTDVILVLDVSGSMRDLKIEKLKEDVNEFINETIPKGNKVAVVTFNDSSVIVSNFTDDSSFLTEKINLLEPNGDTNYYRALISVDEILKDYEKVDKRDCVVLFLTDGFPSIDTPNEVSYYQYLKKTYPYLTINGVNYLMDGVSSEKIASISDQHFSANTYTLSDIIEVATVVPDNYKKLVISDHVDERYFDVNSIKNITASSGTTKIQDNSVIWDLDGIYSGVKANLSFDISLNDELMNDFGIYSTNDLISVSYEIGQVESKEESNLTPVLANNFSVTYESNPPSGCDIEKLFFEENRLVFDAVKFIDEKPICNGYEFKKWEFINGTRRSINSDYFIMPEENVVLRATWSKIDTKMSMEGYVSNAQSLYKLVSDNSLGVDSGINFSNASSSSNGLGIYTRSGTENSNYPIYYYRGAVTNNNLVFANFCWKIVRTTENGGVKLLYNGEPDVNGQCLSTRSNHSGIGNESYLRLSSGVYYYGSSFVYDPVSKVYSLSGDVFSSSWNLNNASNLLGKYTCRSTSASGTCSTVYYIDSPDGSTSAKVYPISVNEHYANASTIGFNKNSDSLESFSYMYSKNYPDDFVSFVNSNVLTQIYAYIVDSYYYGDSVVYENGEYVLQNPKNMNWNDNYTNLSGYYTCLDAESYSCSEVYYIVSGSVSYQHNIKLSDGKLDVEEQFISLSKSIVENDDGTYSLNNPVKVLKTDWDDNYSSYVDYYVCKDLESTTCDKVYYVIRTDDYSVELDDTHGYVYGNDVEWDGEKYKLINTYKSNNCFYKDKSTINSKYHYTCLSNSDVCEQVYYMTSPNQIIYVTLSDGEKMEDVSRNVVTNTISSLAKERLDLWYTIYMQNYTNKLDDSVWCSDRRIYDGSFKSKDTSISNNNYFIGGKNLSSSNISLTLDCLDVNDSFTVSSSNGNGALDYPVGLLTATEVVLAGVPYSTYSANSYLVSGDDWWTMTPASYLPGKVIYVYSRGRIVQAQIHNAQGIRPAIVLKNNTKIGAGDGSDVNPYIVE